MKEAISIEHLSKTYFRTSSSVVDNEMHALEDISLSVAAGELVGIFGPNGCGKTTLLLCVAGVVEPSKGSVAINGKSPQDAIIGFVFQNYREALLPWRTCLDNIAFPLELTGVKKDSRRQKARTLVSELGLGIDLDSFPYQQSGGQQQLVAIARALISNPDVLIMDEPLSSLDIKASISMRSQIEDIWITTKKPTLYVSHDVDACIYLSDRIVLLGDHPGRILEVLENPLPRPRSKFIESAEFHQFRNRILCLYSEVGTP